MTRATWALFCLISAVSLMVMAQDVPVLVSANLSKHPVLQGSSAGSAPMPPGKTAFTETEPGVITTVVGKAGGFSGDGGLAGDASVYGPKGLFVDTSGDLLIADSFSHRIRRVDHATGIITTVAGNSRCYEGICDGSFGGDGGPATAAELNYPMAVAVDADGNLFISDTHNNRIRRVDKSTGIITTVAGSLRGFSGDDGPRKERRVEHTLGDRIRRFRQLVHR